MMEYGSSQENQSDDVRNTVFNTINLINDLESGNVSSSSQNQGRNNKNVSLSSNFVDGIKDKLVDPSRVEKALNQSREATLQAEKFVQMQDFVSKQIVQIKAIIDSNQNEIKSLKETIVSLRSEIETMNKSNNNQNHSGNRNINLPAENIDNNTGDSFGNNFSSFSSPKNDFIDNHKSVDEGDFGSIFQHEKESSNLDNENDSQYQTSLGSNSFASEPSESIFDPLKKSNESESLSSVPEKPISESNTSSSNSEEPNPRVGSYNSGDVLIEKYFYYGNK